MEEIGMMQTGSALISALQLKTIDLAYLNALKTKKITAIALEYLTDEDGSHPMTQSLGEIAGISSVHIATELMSQTHQGKGQLFGNISGLPPTEVVVFGAGTAATAAAKTALELGAQVKVFDHSVARLRKLQNQLKHPISTSILDPKNMVKALRRCDVAIGALWGKSRAPIVVSESMTSIMKKGAVIVDIAIDSGGCFETSEVTTHDQPTKTKYGVIHYGVPNIPARYPKTASLSMSHICLPLLLHISDQGGVSQSVKNHEGFRSGVYLYKGVLTHQTVADWWGITFTPIELLLV
jgi:alanine dehydrogenase